MLPRTLTSTAEATAHYRRVIGGVRALRATEFDQGWVIEEVPSAAETADGRALGMSHAIVDRQTGTVTFHPSVPPMVSAGQHTQARAHGEFAGRVAWPWTSDAVSSIVRAVRKDRGSVPIAVRGMGEDLWIATPATNGDARSYAADGQTITVWEYPGEAASSYPEQKRRRSISGRQVYPVSPGHV